MALLSIENLQLNFRTEQGQISVLRDVSLEIQEGEIVGLVGESGSGKTATALSLARLLPSPPAIYPAGRILLQGRDILGLGSSELTAIRGRLISYIFQEPGLSLNPVMRVGTQIMECLRLHHPEHARKSEVHQLMERVGIPEAGKRFSQYPHQLSGGLQQRIMIAMALACRPALLVADEPTTALDVTTQAQVLKLLAQLQAEEKMAILLITHNLAIVEQLAHRVLVMYAGQIVETAQTSDFFRQPLHPYSQALMRAVPRMGVNTSRFEGIQGHPPLLTERPSGCAFHPRCQFARPDCSKIEPKLTPGPQDRLIRCPYYSESLTSGQAKESR